MRIYFLLVTISFLFLPSLAKAGPGCDFTPKNETEGAIDFIEALIDGTNKTPATPEKDFHIELPLCITDIHRNVDKVEVSCEFRNANAGSTDLGVGAINDDGFRHYYQAQNGKVPDIDEILKLDYDLIEGVNRSDITHVVCSISSFNVLSTAYGNVGDSSCETIKPDELCSKKGTTPITYLTYDIKP